MSITVYRNTDRIQLKVYDVVFSVKPFSFKQKADISAAITMESGTQTEDGHAAVQKLIKYSIKEVKGINYPDGSAMKLQFDDDDCLMDESIDELLNLEITPDLTTSLYSFIRGIPKNLTDSEGKIKTHVTILPYKAVPKKK